MSFIIRPAVIGDLWALQPVMRPAELQRYGIQLARSQAFALVDKAVFAAGGLYVDAEARERVCWMLAAKDPPARDLLAGVRLILDHAGAGWPIVADIDGRERRHVRFAEVLGFVSSARPRPPSLPAHILRLERAS